MALSVTNPIGAALDRTKRILFKPFKIGKWFVLGFCAFLAYLGQGGGGPPGGGGGGSPSGGSGGGGTPPSGGGGGGGGGGSSGGSALSGGEGSDGASSDGGAEVVDWIMANPGVAIAIGLIALIILIVMFVIGLLVLWVRCRGKFMFLDGVVHNRGAVVKPWKEFRRYGNSLFFFSFAFGFSMFVIMMLIAALGLMLAWPDIRSSEFTSASITAIVIGVPLFLGTIIVYSIIAVLLEDFVVPTMYVQNVPVMSAWRIVRTEVLAGNVGTIILYFLMKIVLSIAIGIITVMATCLTCCLAIIPYLGRVILLPLYVFKRCYPVCFLEQLGPSWKFFPPDPPEPPDLPDPEVPQAPEVPPVMPMPTG